MNANINKKRVIPKESKQFMDLRNVVAEAGYELKRNVNGADVSKDGTVLLFLPDRTAERYVDEIIAFDGTDVLQPLIDALTATYRKG